jgi:two-component system nitrogen regulation response regulator GlnG
MMAQNDEIILIIDDDSEIRYSLERVLSSRGYKLQSAASGEEGVKVAKEISPAVIFLDNRMEGMSGIETLQHLKSSSPKSMVILMTAYGTTQTAIEAMKFGAFDYILKPFDLKKVLSLTESALKSYRDLNQDQTPASQLINSEDYKEGIVGSSEKMREVFKIIGQVTASDATVMISGESGTGKELVARCVYQHSHRSENTFIAVNCAAIPENLIESELFGHEKGAFTGATNQRIGKFELCNNGTIFLDEIGDMSLSTQTKILRALQEGEIQRVGGTEVIKVNVRMITATNKNLQEMVKENTFREDLYYRLNVVKIHLPALRERLEDIPELVDFMLQKFHKKKNVAKKVVSKEVLNVLTQYRWPGNVRELENVMHRSAVIAQGEKILLKDLPQEIVNAVLSQNESAGKGSNPEPLKESDSGVTSIAESELAMSESAPKVNPVAAVSGKVESSSAPVVLPVIDDIPKSKLPKQNVVEDTAQSVTFGTLGKSNISLEEAFDILYEKIREKHSTLILEESEKGILERVLKEMGGNQVKASTMLGITRATLRKRIDQYGIKY